jgi:D-aminopeptidase
MANERKPRLRDLGIVIGTMEPGPLNAITDVAGVRVGHTTLVSGEGPLVVGEGPVRTGVTAIHPHAGAAFREMVPAAIVVLNGAGEMTGRSQVDEYGYLETPIVITNTFSVGQAHRAMVEWLCRDNPDLGTRHFVIPLVAETYDGWLNDVVGQHVRSEHVVAALDSATGGPVSEGAVGGGTGMMTLGFKGGIGTSSRRVPLGDTGYTVGVLVQSNFGALPDLTVAGVPVGREYMARRAAAAVQTDKEGSIIVVVGTDAPMLDRQLRRLATRATLGIARVGGLARQTSGDILIAFSNAEVNRSYRDETLRPGDGWTPRVEYERREVNDTLIDDFFQATVEATEEAILNAMIAAETTTGRDGHVFHKLPHADLVEIMRAHGHSGAHLA